MTTATERSMSEFLTLQEVAARLRVSWKTINRLVNNREITAIKIGRVWRISEIALRDYVNSIQQSAVA